MHVVNHSREPASSSIFGICECPQEQVINYFMKTIPSISHLLLPIETTIWNQFIATITGGRTCNEKEWKLLPLPTRYGGLAIPIFHEQVEVDLTTHRE